MRDEQHETKSTGRDGKGSIGQAIDLNYNDWATERQVCFERHDGRDREAALVLAFVAEYPPSRFFLRMLLLAKYMSFIATRDLACSDRSRPAMVVCRCAVLRGPDLDHGSA